eukprot:GHVT01017513.1.p2 GENE.GHVT01017513.1~~GHVT01017513.1.p2  ORF type:complete len:109 (+),score=28.12 GHVT01017513.1:447-773(+)
MSSSALGLRKLRSAGTTDGLAGHGCCCPTCTTCAPAAAAAAVLVPNMKRGSGEPHENLPLRHRRASCSAPRRSALNIRNESKRFVDRRVLTSVSATAVWLRFCSRLTR